MVILMTRKHQNSEAAIATPTNDRKWSIAIVREVRHLLLLHVFRKN